MHCRGGDPLRPKKAQQWSPRRRRSHWLAVKSVLGVMCGARAWKPDAWGSLEDSGAHCFLEIYLCGTSPTHLSGLHGVLEASGFPATEVRAVPVALEDGTQKCKTVFVINFGEDVVRLDNMISAKAGQ